MNYSKLREAWRKEENITFKGWNFSYLENKWVTEKLPWNYRDILKKYLNPNYKLLDMGTGGGEFLLSLNHPYNNTSVTEMWEPNVKLCKEKLEPLGITVKQIFTDTHLPFDDNSFDIVINRHSSFNIKEIRRIWTYVLLKFLHNETIENIRFSRLSFATFLRKFLNLNINGELLILISLIF